MMYACIAVVVGFSGHSVLFAYIAAMVSGPPVGDEVGRDDPPAAELAPEPAPVPPTKVDPEGSDMPDPHAPHWEPPNPPTVPAPPTPAGSAASGVAEPEPGSAPTPNQEATPVATQRPRQAQAGAGRGLTLTGIALVVPGGAAAIAAGVLGAEARRLGNQALAVDLDSDLSGSEQARVDQLEARASRLRVGSIVALATGAAAIGTGVLLIVLGHYAKQRARTQLAPGPGLVGLAINHRF